MFNASEVEKFISACRPLAAVSHETIHSLKAYAELLEKWQQRINLVSTATLKGAWERHFLDSAQLLPHIPESANIVDIGSGAGFPGLVLAAFGHTVTMIESDQKKVAFMQEVTRAAGIKTARFENSRIEKATPLPADYVTARALADVQKLLDYAEPYMNLGAKCLFLKGDRLNEELTLAAQKWHMDFSISQSITDPKASVLLIRKASRV